MIWIIFFVTWLVAGGLYNPGEGFIAACMFTYLFFVSTKLKALENKLHEVIDQLNGPRTSNNTLNTPHPAIRSCFSSPESAPGGANCVVQPNLSATPVPPLVPAPASNTITRHTPRPKSFAENLEAAVGATIATYLLKGNPIAKVGVFILFFGVVFGLKLAAQAGIFPIELRLAASILGAIALLAVGWKLENKNRQFAMILQGAGSGIFYITVFIAFRLYHLLPGPFAFLLLISSTALLAALSVLQNARSLAVLALVGGFLAPALTSKGGGSHILLFAYLAILNLGIFGICRFRAWRSVNLTGVIFTFLMAAAWGSRYYNPQLFYSIELFLVFFIGLYTFITISFTERAGSKQCDTVDTLLTFGVPFLTLLLQYGIVKQFEYGLAWSCLGFGTFYMLTSRIVFNRDAIRMRFLAESYFAIGLGLLSLTVPFAFSGSLSSAIWAVEGAALLWSGVRQNRIVTRCGGYLLLTLSSLLFFGSSRPQYYANAFTNSFFIGVFLLSLAHVLTAKILSDAKETHLASKEKSLCPFILAIGVLWWFAGGYIEVWTHATHWLNFFRHSLPTFHFANSLFWIAVSSLFGSFSVLVLWLISRSLKLPDLSLVRFIAIPIHTLLLIRLIGSRLFVNTTLHPLMSFGFLAWPIFFATHFYILKQEESASPERIYKFQHLLPVWILTVILTLEAYWLVDHFVKGGEGWSLATIFLVPSVIVLLLSWCAERAQHWPFIQRSRIYFAALELPVGWIFLASALLCITSAGSISPLPYIPLLNPLDIVQALSLVAMIRWLRRSEKAGITLRVNKSLYQFLLGVWGFIWATSILLRCVHHYQEVAWEFDALFDSVAVQTTLSIFWSLFALALMSLAHNKNWRAVWKAGAALIGIVVLKLFVVDLSNHGNIGRTAAFIGVGLLMLVIGYLAPIPPDIKVKDT